MKKITIKRAYNPDLVKENVLLMEISGFLYEYKGLQFCICLSDGFWYAIELSTGHSAADYARELNDSDEYCIDKIKEIMTRRDKSQYERGLKSCEAFMQSKGFTIPINEKIKTDDSN